MAGRQLSARRWDPSPCSGTRFESHRSRAVSFVGCGGRGRGGWTGLGGGGASRLATDVAAAQRWPGVGVVVGGGAGVGGAVDGSAGSTCFFLFFFSPRSVVVDYMYWWCGVWYRC